MDKIAFVFSGQGDQFPGMGRALYDTYPAAREVFDLCDRIRPGTSVQCFAGTEAELKETKNTQPCLFAMELAAAAVLRGLGITPAAAAGFSLGEVTAATVSGIFDWEAGFRLVCKRGELMQRESEKVDASMAAVLRLTPEEVWALSRRYSDVYPVNFNCPGQITVSGLTPQVRAFSSDVKAAGGRAIPLKTGGAFHSPLMAEAARDFAELLAGTERNRQAIPLYSNLTAKPYDDDVVGLLSEQIDHPVQWEPIIRNMIDEGIDTFIEIGPGTTLTNLIKKISPAATALSVTEYLAEVSPC